MTSRTVPTAAVLGGLALLAGACARAPEPSGAAPSFAVADALGGGDAAGFARAMEPPRLEFPRDHGPHPEFRTEWWYVTANVRTAQGRRFGVQLVFFRHALAPRDPSAPPRAASLAARETILAHAAVTDVDGGRFWFAERLGRVAAGLAGVDGPGAVPFRVWCGDWSASARQGGDGLLPLALRAAGDGFAFELELAPGKPVVLQGDRGLSRKSGEPGNASIYYSLTRLPIAGSIAVANGERHAVRGDAWLDREWSTSALGEGQVGWDWFSLQLDDGSEVMWYQLRRRDGTRDGWSRGTVVARDGTAAPLLPADVDAVPDGTWTAPDGAARYPARWTLRARGSEPFELTVEPLLADQELRALVRYWEGAVAVRGTRAGRAVTGHGYLEMTGYSRQ